jgi:cytochrome P450
MLDWMEGFLLSVQLLPLTPEQLTKANTAVSSLNAYFTDLIAERRRAPQENDLLTMLINEADAGKLSDDELCVNAWTLFVGGHDTTARTICNAVATLDDHPDQLARLIADPSLWPNAVEEVLRFVGPVQATHRLLREEIELGGHTVPADTPVIMYLSAANRDESWCPHAAEFDTGRAVPADHLAFGAGPHRCPGAHMARMMVQVALEALYSRLPGLRMTDIVWDTEVMNFRGPASLHVSWNVSGKR